MCLCHVWTCVEMSGHGCISYQVFFFFVIFLLSFLPPSLLLLPSFFFPPYSSLLILPCFFVFVFQSGNRYAVLPHAKPLAVMVVDASTSRHIIDQYHEVHVCVRVCVCVRASKLHCVCALLLVVLLLARSGKSWGDGRRTSEQMEACEKEI